MIKYLFTLSFMMLCTLTKAQNVSLDELITLRTKSLLYVGEFLVERGWSVARIKEQTKTTTGYMLLGYNPNKDTDSPPYIDIDVSRKPASNSLMITFFTEATYNDYTSRIEILGYKMTSIDVNIGVYETDKTVIVIRFILLDDGRAAYRFAIYDILTFKTLFNKDGNKK